MYVRARVLFPFTFLRLGDFTAWLPTDLKKIRNEKKLRGKNLTVFSFPFHPTRMNNNDGEKETASAPLTLKITIKLDDPCFSTMIPNYNDNNNVITTSGSTNTRLADTALVRVGLAAKTITTMRIIMT